MSLLYLNFKYIDAQDHTLFIGPPEAKAEVIEWNRTLVSFDFPIVFCENKTLTSECDRWFRKCYRLEGRQMSKQER